MNQGTLPRCERDYQENKLHGSFAPVRIPHNRSIRFLEVFCHTDEVTFKANVAFSLKAVLFTVRATEWQKRKYKYITVHQFCISMCSSHRVRRLYHWCI